MLQLLKRSVRHARGALADRRAEAHIQRARSRSCQATGQSFDFPSVSTRTIGFLESMRGPDATRYRYASGCEQTTLYASAYACLTYSLLGELQAFDAQTKAHWIAYFDSFQSQASGLFDDPVVRNRVFDDSDWWGARHLTLHMANAYVVLGCQPRHPLSFLKPYCGEGAVAWLDQQDWHSAFTHSNDVDNKIMNIGGLLQYSRDFLGDDQAGAAVSRLKDYLRSKVDPDTGMWGRYDIDRSDDLSRMVQFAYHLYRVLFYDGEVPPQAERIALLVLRTQNRLGGFGVRLNSSACEDIDSIDLLIRLWPHCSPTTKAAIDQALGKSLDWVLANQAPDGGFVFRLNEPFIYGAPETSSRSNEGAMLPTWFRTLSLAYLAKHLGLSDDFRLTRCPGYEF